MSTPAVRTKMGGALTKMEFEPLVRSTPSLLPSLFAQDPYSALRTILGKTGGIHQPHVYQGTRSIHPRLQESQHLSLANATGRHCAQIFWAARTWSNSHCWRALYSILQGTSNNGERKHALIAQGLFFFDLVCGKTRSPLLELVHTRGRVLPFLRMCTLSTTRRFYAYALSAVCCHAQHGRPKLRAAVPARYRAGPCWSSVPRMVIALHHTLVKRQHTFFLYTLHTSTFFQALCLERCGVILLTPAAYDGTW